MRELALVCVSCQFTGCLGPEFFSVVTLPTCLPSACSVAHSVLGGAGDTSLENRFPVLMELTV